MIFGVAEIIALPERYATLKPGDLIITGTPERILLRKKSPIWLTAGDEVVVEIDRLGTLTNLLVAPEVRARGLPGHRKVAKSDPKLEAGRSHSRRNAGPPQLEA